MNARRTFKYVIFSCLLCCICCLFGCTQPNINIQNMDISYLDNQEVDTEKIQEFNLKYDEVASSTNLSSLPFIGDWKAVSSINQENVEIEPVEDIIHFKANKIADNDFENENIKGYWEVIKENEAEYTISVESLYKDNVASVIYQYDIGSDKLTLDNGYEFITYERI